MIATLPPELRNCIDELVLIDDACEYAYPRSKRTDGLYQRGILRVSNQIRSEVLQIYYANNVIDICIETFDLTCFSNIVDWLRGVIRVCGPKPFKRVMWTIRWSVMTAYPERLDKKILTARQLVQAIRELGVELVSDEARTICGRLPGGQAIREAGRLWKHGVPRDQLWKDDLNEHYAALMQALDLGKRGHDEGWSAKMLDQNFEHFAASWGDG